MLFIRVLNNNLTLLVMDFNHSVETWVGWGGRGVGYIYP